MNQQPTSRRRRLLYFDYFCTLFVVHFTVVAASTVSSRQFARWQWQIEGMTSLMHDNKRKVVNTPRPVHFQVWNATIMCNLWPAWYQTYSCTKSLHSVFTKLYCITTEATCVWEQLAQGCLCESGVSKRQTYNLLIATFCNSSILTTMHYIPYLSTIRVGWFIHYGLCIAVCHIFWKKELLFYTIFMNCAHV